MQESLSRETKTQRLGRDGSLHVFSFAFDFDGVNEHEW